MLEPGQRIDKYEIASFIGRGGMSTVYRAFMRGPAAASKQVALKVIHRRLAADHDFVLMFLDEMRLAMAMEHRNIVQTFDAGKSDDDYYMVMELVEGCSLRQLLSLHRERPLPRDVALFVAMEVCAALAHAHGLERGGVVHRDVSPSNVLLSRGGDVKLVDFGVAKAAGRMSQTAANAYKGKLRYMAPEQARGQPVPASDLFALGALLYEALGGAPARQAASIEEVRLFRRPATALSTLRPEVSPAVEALVAQCLERDPAKRPTAEQARQQLRQEHDRLTRDTDEADPHRRLQRYLVQMGGTGERRAEAARLADIMLDQVKALPTDPNLQPPRAGTEDSTAPLPAPAATPTPVQREQRRGRGLVPAAALLLLVLSGAVLGWLLLAPGPPAPAGAAHPADGRVSRDLASPPDLAPAEDRRAVEDRPRPADRGPRQRRPRRRPPGRLILNTEPWSRVYVDGRFRGVTPIEGLALRPGRHRLRLVNAREHISRSLTIRIRPGQTLRKVLVLR